MKVQGLILVLLFPWFVQAQQLYYGTRLSTFTLTGAESQDDLQVLPIHDGDIITAENIRASIQALYESGHYSSIEVDAAPAPNGTTSLTFRVRPNYFFSTFRIDPPNILDRPLSGYIRLPVGDKFTETALDQVVEDTKNLLKSEGYYQATLTVEKAFDEATHLAFVTLRTKPGARAKVGKLSVHGGEETFPHMELPNAFGLKVGDIFTTARLEKGVSAIRAKFTQLDFINTQVNIDPDPEHAYNAAANTVDLNVSIQPGQFAYVKPVGFAISQKKLRGLVPIYEEGMVDRDLVDEGALNITRYVQQQGYFDAEVMADIIDRRLRTQFRSTTRSRPEFDILPWTSALKATISSQPTKSVRG